MRLGTMLLVFTAACGDGSNDQATWTVDHVAEGGALLGVWGSGPHDVWAVGGQIDRSLILHGDGETWQRIDIPNSALLSNIYGFSVSDIYAVGERGLVLHYDGQSWAKLESGTDLPLFGIWGASGEDVWIVGGKHPTPVVLRGSRTGFHAVELPADVAPNVVFKAHGFAANDVILVGTNGVVRWDGLAWRRDSVPTTEPLFSTWGTGPRDVYAVGGSFAGEILHSDGRAWRRVVELPIGTGLRGVFTSLDGPTIAVSANGFVVEIDREGAVVQPALPELCNLHGVWGDGLGTTYVVGGDLAAYPYPKHGVMFRRQ